MFSWEINVLISVVFFLPIVFSLFGYMYKSFLRLYDERFDECDSFGDYCDEFIPLSVRGIILQIFIFLIFVPIIARYYDGFWDYFGQKINKKNHGDDIYIGLLDDKFVKQEKILEKKLREVKKLIDPRCWPNWPGNINSCDNLKNVSKEEAKRTIKEGKRRLKEIYEDAERLYGSLPYFIKKDKILNFRNKIYHYYDFL